MTNASESDPSAIEQIRRRIGRTAFVAVVGGLSAGTAFYLLGVGSASTVILASTVGVLLALPMVNVLAVLAEEIRQRDWVFTWLAVAVLGLLTYAIVRGVLKTL